jgi:threonine dehydratase
VRPQVADKPERSSGFVISIDDIRAAAGRLSGVARRTPVVRSDALDELSGNKLFFKCENEQLVGAFKFRGAYNALAQFTDEERRRGVVTFSSGNHGQGIALAAKMLGISATVVMPSKAPRVKLDAVRTHGAAVVLYDPATENREVIAQRIASETGALLVPPFDDYRIMAGQGTAALELLEEIPDLGILLVPVGGGGLLAGSSTAAKGVRPAIRVFGVEPEGANDWQLSWERGERTSIPQANTIADGLRPTAPGKLTWPIARARADGIITVSDDEIRGAMRALKQYAAVTVEPSGAASAAAALYKKIKARGERVGIILSGGNVDSKTFAQIMDASAAG